MNSRTAFAVATAVLLGGCATNSYSPPPAAATPPPAMPRVYFYPQRGQDARQQDRDRYECFNWAVAQTGFDPSRQPLPRQTREVVVPARPAGSLALAGAATGALIGAAVSDPWDRGEGAIIGAVAGTALGAVAESAQQQGMQQVSNQAQQSRYDSATSRYEDRAGGFQRAMSVCLEGRGYAVK